tara:strand:+ start:346 stop:666 length:321 start_codon:yes stop_codon:yes gene_type:complete
MSSIAEDKYDFMVDKGLLCSPKEVIIKQMEEENWVAVIRIEQTSKGWWTYVYFQEDKYIPGRVKRMKIFEFEPTGNTACLLSENNGSVQFNSKFWNDFFLGKGMDI